MSPRWSAALPRGSPGDPAEERCARARPLPPTPEDRRISNEYVRSPRASGTESARDARFRRPRPGGRKWDEPVGAGVPTITVREDEAMNRQSLLLLVAYAIGAPRACLAACGSTSPQSASSRMPDATSPVPQGVDARAENLDAGGSGALEGADGGIVTIPCHEGTTLLSCPFPRGGMCVCASDGPTCTECDDAGCTSLCGDASCEKLCAPGQIGLACGGPGVPPPPPGTGGRHVTYVFAEAPDACALAPNIDSVETAYYCCPSMVVDP